jgi:hypothetical protein
LTLWVGAGAVDITGAGGGVTTWAGGGETTGGGGGVTTGAGGGETTGGGGGEFIGGGAGVITSVVCGLSAKTGGTQKLLPATKTIIWIMESIFINIGLIFCLFIYLYNFFKNPINVINFIVNIKIKLDLYNSFPAVGSSGFYTGTALQTENVKSGTC